MQGIAGQWFKPFALTIACAVLVSLFVSFSLDPMLSAYWPDPQLEAHERKNPIARFLDRFNQWFDRQADRYKGVIAWALDHRLAILAIVAVSFFGAIALQVFFGGGGFIPDSDRSEINLSIKTPPGSNLTYTGDQGARVGAASPAATAGGLHLHQHRQLHRLGGRRHREHLRQAGPQEEARRLAAGGSSGGTATRPSRSAASRPPSPRGGRAATRSRSSSSSRPGHADAHPGGAGDRDRAAEGAGAADIDLSTRGDRPELEIQLNRGLAGSLGLTVAQVSQSLRPAFAGVDSGDWIDPLGKTRDVTVRLAPEARANLTDIEKLPLMVTGGSAAGAASAAGIHWSSGRRGAQPDPPRTGGHDPPQHRTGPDRSPRPRQGGDGGGQRRGALPLRGDGATSRIG